MGYGLWVMGYELWAMGYGQLVWWGLSTSNLAHGSFCRIL